MRFWRCILVVRLLRRRRVLMRRYLAGCRLRVNATLAAVVAYVVVAVVIDDRFVHIGVVDHRPVDVAHGGVVAEGIAAPSTADVAGTGVSVPVVDATVESYRAAPIAPMPIVPARSIAPVARCIKLSCRGRDNPRSRYPAIAAGSPSPISWSPYRVRPVTGRLGVNRHRRRRERDADTDRDLCRRRHGSGDKRDKNEGCNCSPY